MKLKKLSAALISIIMTASALSGCSDKSEGDSSSEENKISVSESSSDDSDAVLERPSNIVYEDSMTYADKAITEKASSPKKRTRQKTSDNKWSDLDTQAKKKLTIMIYMVGSDLESNYKAATSDLLEMMDSGLANDDVNLVVYTGGSDTWWLPIENNSYLVYDKEGGFIPFSDKERNMGKADTFSSFLNETAEKFPAENYGLICWDHGGGPLIGYGIDETYSDPNNIIEGDCLSLEEMKSALDSSVFRKKKLQFFGFDACIMSSVEIADMISDYSDCLIASPESEPACGWNYSFLNSLNKSLATEDISKNIINTYAEYMKENVSAFFNPEYSLYSLDLTKNDILQDAVDNLFASLEKDFEGKNAAYITASRRKSKEYSEGSGVDLVDLGNLSTYMYKLYPDESKKVLKAVDQVVTYGVTNIKNSTGLSLYYPFQSYGYYELLGKDFIAENSSDSYKKFMKKFLASWNSTPSSAYDTDLDEKADVPQDSKENYKDSVYDFYQLNNNQLNDMSKAYYTVFEKSKKMDEFFKGDCYFPIMEEIPLYPDEKGTLAIDLDPEIIIASADNSDSIIAHFKYLSDDGDSTNYASVGNAICTDSQHFPFGEREFCDFSINTKHDADKAVIRNLQTASEEEQVLSLSGKNDISADSYNCLYCYYKPAIPDKKNNKPYFDIFDSDKSSFSLLDMNNSFYFKPSYLSELNEDIDFYYQIIIVDKSGASHASEIKQIPEYEAENGIKTVSADSGKMSFMIYDDHAELVEYLGDAKKVTVPDKAEEKKVTVIGSKAFESNDSLEEVIIPSGVGILGENAFSSCDNLKKVSIPDSVTVISSNCFMGDDNITELNLPSKLEYLGDYALKYTNITNAVIPASVEKIGANPFSNCDQLSKLSVDKNNKYYVMEDDVLFDKNKKKIITFITNNRKSYNVPEGVEEICSEAFSTSGGEILSLSSFSFMGDSEETAKLEKISFPKSLKRIDSYAFYECNTLTEINLPENLEYIGTYAFGSSFYDADDDYTINIHIGPYVSDIRKRSFCMFKKAKFDVDENNAFYSSVKGKLMNVSGTTEIEWYK